MRARPRVLAAALLIGAVSADAQTIAQEQRALAAATRDAQAASARAARYERAAAAAGDTVAHTRRAQVALAARIQAAEARIAAARARLTLIARLQARHRARLAILQAPLARLTAALQTLARRPAAVALLQPGSIDDVVHVRALLSAAIPMVRVRSASVRAELARAARLRADADATTRTLLAGRQRLQADRQSLGRAEAAQRTRAARLGDTAMAEQDRALALGERARDIVTLMDALQVQAARRDRLASLPGPIPRPIVPGLTLPPPDAVPDPTPPGDYRLPVLGRVVAGLGEVSTAGIRARGVTMATAPAAQVVAPAAGHVAYAGPFRGYGRIAIIDHGGGWTTLLAGMGSVTVAAGETVDPGTPIGAASVARPAITIELRHDGLPADILPLVHR